MLIPVENLIGKTVSINGTPTTVTKCEHVVNYQKVLINGTLEVTYASFEKMTQQDDADAVLASPPPPPDQPATVVANETVIV